ncbi:hypothetical protein B2G71_16860 [Novosphingobium sp. PC22D]|uniref:hypothetical protein n=1 Tax=Novosphingobium sp. PC22D TaxID=1962403 RepID=UPI000BF158C8|nr:hypothetical protein [Novosphingobium sp. PC22D]PEQ11499.1 hypothetical protein B2G71_16860 [Novosphingobium sp. PC22D]
MRTRPAVCARKKRFASEDDANAAAERAPFALRAYRCGLCRRWHLTGRTKGMKLPPFELARRKTMRTRAE